MDLERFRTTRLRPLDETIAQSARAELDAAVKAGETARAFQAISQLDLMGEATKPGILYGLSTVGKNKSWQQELIESIWQAKYTGKPEEILKLVRIAHLMRLTENSLGHKITGFFSKSIPSADQLYQDHFNQAQADIAERQRIEAEERARAAEERAEAAREETDRRRREAAEAARTAKETAERERKEREEEANRAKEEASRPFKPEPDTEKVKKSPDWLKIQDDFTKKWRIAKQKQSLPEGDEINSTFIRFRAGMELLQAYILDTKVKSTPTTTRAALEALIPLIWINTEQVKSSLAGASKVSGALINPYAKVIYLPKNLRPEQPLYASALTKEQKAAATKLMRRFSYTLFPNIEERTLTDAETRYPESYGEYDQVIAILRTQFNAAYEGFKDHR